MKKIHRDSAASKVPHVVLDVHADGTLTAAVDGATLDPPSEGPWRRSSLGQVIDLATGGRATPARVEVHESDGTVFSDPIATGSRRRSTAQVPAAALEETIGTADPSAFAMIEEAGFLPGEDVAVALVLGHTQAGPSGTARAMLHSPGHGTGDVVLLGRTSGTLAIRPLP